MRRRSVRLVRVRGISNRRTDDQSCNSRACILQAAKVIVPRLSEQYAPQRGFAASIAQSVCIGAHSAARKERP